MFKAHVSSPMVVSPIWQAEIKCRRSSRKKSSSRRSSLAIWSSPADFGYMLFIMVSPLRAELLTMTLTLIHYAQEFGNSIIKMDCQSILSLLSNSRPVTGSLAAKLQRATLFLTLNQSTIQYCPRETNTVSHWLARHDYRAVGLQRYTSLHDLPCEVRGDILMDLQLPALRHW